MTTEKSLPLSTADTSNSNNAWHKDWPAGITPLSCFQLTNLDASIGYVATEWDKETKTLWAMQITVGGKPPKSRVPRPISGIDAEWCSRVKIVKTGHIPQHIALPETYSEEKRLKVDTRTSMLDEFLSPYGRYRWDKRIIVDSTYRSTKARQVAEKFSNENRTFTLGDVYRLFTRYIWYQGARGSLRDEDPRKGPKGQSLVFEAGKRKARTQARTTLRTKRRATTLRDLELFESALRRCWAAGPKLSLARTHADMLTVEYQGRKLSSLPTLSTFEYHAAAIIAKNELWQLRLGSKGFEQYLEPKRGSATDIGHRAIRVLDMDAWAPKINVFGVINRKFTRITGVKVVFGIDRNSTLCMGYEVSVAGETAESYSRCLVSAMTDPLPRLEALGLGLLIDGFAFGIVHAILTDAGAGHSKKFTDRSKGVVGMKLATAPGRPDMNSVVERFNGFVGEAMAMLHSDAYTRHDNPVAKEQRQLARKRKGIWIGDLDSLIAIIIYNYNTTAAKDNLRDYTMYNRRVGITPIEIFRYYETELGFGDAAEELSIRAICDKLLPFERTTCTEGVVISSGISYTSERLRQRAKEEALAGRSSFKVLVNKYRPDGTTLLYRDEQGNVSELPMTTASREKYGAATAAEIAVLNHSISMEKKELAARRGHFAPQIPPSRKTGGQVPVREQRIIDDIQEARGITVDVQKSDKPSKKAYSPKGYDGLQEQAYDVKASPPAKERIESSNDDIFADEDAKAEEQFYSRRDS